MFSKSLALRASKVASERWSIESHNSEVISHLKRGDLAQRRAARSLAELQLLDWLASYNPLIVGTMPLDIHIPESDIDVICNVRNSHAFIRLLAGKLGGQYPFALRRTTLQGAPSVVCAFRHRETLYEIVGQPVETPAQLAYIHFMVEADLLRLPGGSRAKAAIRRLKRSGMKTEPAFAHHYGLTQNPYEAVASLWQGSAFPLLLQVDRCSKSGSGLARDRGRLKT